MSLETDATTTLLDGPARQRRSDGGGGERFQPGTLLAGRYRITHALGQGGMGEVYRADDTRLGVPVALKFLPAGLAQDEDLLSLLLNEARLARTITHENVCRIHDVGESDGLHFISMELIAGEDLAALLRRIGRLPQDKAIDVARGLCAGLDAAHGQGVLHRDLKPSNLMIDDCGEVRITDFGLSHHVEGLARLRRDEGLARLRRDEGLARLGTEPDAPEALAGTPSYMAPEQMTGEVSVRTDLYALGLVLYELFTGRRAFEAASTAELARLHREAAPTPPSSFVHELDPAVEKVILRCLEKDPRARPASAQAVAAALPGRSDLATGTVLNTLLVSGLDEMDDEIEERHRRLTRELVQEHAGREVAGQLLFQRPIHAVLFARAYHEALSRWRPPIKARIGIHLGEVVLRREEPSGGAAAIVVEGPAKATAERLMGLAGGGQTLLSRAAFDVARRSAVDDGVQARRLAWLAHGRCRGRDHAARHERSDPRRQPGEPGRHTPLHGAGAARRQGGDRPGRRLRPGRAALPGALRRPGPRPGTRLAARDRRRAAPRGRRRGGRRRRRAPPGRRRRPGAAAAAPGRTARRTPRRGAAARHPRAGDGPPPPSARRRRRPRRRGRSRPGVVAARPGGGGAGAGRPAAGRSPASAPRAGSTTRRGAPTARASSPRRRTARRGSGTWRPARRPSASQATRGGSTPRRGTATAPAS